MVDFNTETAINTPAKNIEGVLLFEKREAFLLAKESYKVLVYQGSQPSLAVARARLLNLIDNWHGYLARTKQPVKEWIKKIDDDNITSEELFNIFYEISKLMDSSNLTKIDREKIDRQNIELENEYTGLD